MRLPEKFSYYPGLSNALPDLPELSSTPEGHRLILGYYSPYLLDMQMIIGIFAGISNNFTLKDRLNRFCSG